MTFMNDFSIFLVEKCGIMRPWGILLKRFLLKYVLLECNWHLLKSKWRLDLPLLDPLLNWIFNSVGHFFEGCWEPCLLRWVKALKRCLLNKNFKSHTLPIAHFCSTFYKSYWIITEYLELLHFTPLQSRYSTLLVACIPKVQNSYAWYKILKQARLVQRCFETSMLFHSEPQESLVQ